MKQNSNMAKWCSRERKSPKLKVTRKYLIVRWLNFIVCIVLAEPLELSERMMSSLEQEHMSYLMLALLSIKVSRRENKKSRTRKTLKNSEKNRKILKRISPMAKLTQLAQDSILILTLIREESVSTLSEQDLKLQSLHSLKVEVLNHF